jgi:DNA-binding NarL/FixJ family response regulator
MNEAAQVNESSEHDALVHMDLVTTSSTSMTDTIRVALVGSERVTRAGLRMLIDSQPGLQVIGEVECCGDPGKLWRTTHPHVALVDLDSQGSLDCITVLRQMRDSSARIIVLTGNPDSDACSSAIERGVLGVVSKQQAPDVLFNAIERVHAGEVWLNRTKVAGVLGTLRAAAARKGREAAGVKGLLPRERQVITLVGQGLRNGEIASAIYASESTVRNCLGSIFKKLGIANRAHLMLYAIQEGFVDTSVRAQTLRTARRDVLRLATSAGRSLNEPGQP